MSHIEIRDDKHALDRGIRELKKRLKRDGMFQELKRREYYMSPSEKLRFKKNEAFKRRKRDERKKEWNDKNKQTNSVGDNKWQQDIKV